MRFYIYVSTFLLLLIPISMAAQENDGFVLSNKELTAQIVFSDNESQVVHLSVGLLAGDVYEVTGRKLGLNSELSSKYQLKVGTIGISNQFDKECQEAGINIFELKSSWETYVIKVVANKRDSGHYLYVVGSDSRGTAYGLMEISRMIGVSPWSWWADVKPEKKESIVLPHNLFVKDGPKVKYRGIFLNDEDWGLQPWAAKTFEPEIGDIGPKTYDKIFELLLRLRANTIWPAMHPSTKAFYTIPGNKEVAAKYQMYVGTSHAEPMLRNNVGEWNHKKFGEYNYATNKDAVKHYWQDRIEELNPEDKYIVTLGMRGIHDSGMQGDFTNEEKVEMLETIIYDQREMLTKVLKRGVTDIPQAFVPYKEVLEIYSRGAKVSDDVTLVWPDDNHGYIRQLSNTAERKRGGGSGVYYHISYWGRPHDFLWLESVPVSLIWEEMNKAYKTGAKNIWVVNVGDIKPNEIGMNFFLEMAWNPDQFLPESLNSYYFRFSAEQFGETYAEEIGEILEKYFQLGFSRKPEHMGWTSVYPNTPMQDPEFSLFINGDEVQQRIDAYNKLEERVMAVQYKLPKHLQDAFYQLVAYKVLGASNMSKKILYAYKSRIYAQQERASTNRYADKAKAAYENIIEITNNYNQQNNGKWMHMMSYNPRELPVFDMPEVGYFEPSEKASGRVMLEGDSLAIEPNMEATLPVFLLSTQERYFIDIFNTGQEAIKWTAKAKDPWVKISSMGGKTSNEERIWVSVDWSLIDEETKLTSSIELKLGKITYNVRVEARRLKLPKDKPLFVEDNGIVSIEAEHFNEAQNTERSEWKLIQGLGRQNDAVGSFPITANPLVITNKQAATLTYSFFVESGGEAFLRFYCLPSQSINSNYKLRFAISIDEEKPIMVDASLKEVMDEHNKEWAENVLRAINIVETGITIPQAGRHQLKISMIDPGVVLDKIEIYKDKRRDSYFGAKETKSRIEH